MADVDGHGELTELLAAWQVGERDAFDRDAFDRLVQQERAQVPLAL